MYYYAQKDLDAAVKWYKDNRPLYESLARKVEQIVRDNLDDKGIVYHSVTSRSKSPESYAEKAAKDKYSNPVAQIKDMAGIRVITYLESDVQKVANVIEGLFSIDKKNSLDQSQLLGSDRVGYRSVHYVAELDSARCKIPEYKRYAGLAFEIQIRSLLQHAWAEIDHDRNYKFAGKLPTELERRFYLVAGMLEVADREFVSLAQGIEKYQAVVTEEIESDDLDIEVNSVSLREYLSKRFSSLIQAGTLDPKFGALDDASKDVINELLLFGISRLSQLDRAIPADFGEKKALLEPGNNFVGLVRSILMINDVEKYLRVSWQGRWNLLGGTNERLLREYGVDTEYIRKRVKQGN